MSTSTFPAPAGTIVNKAARSVESRWLTDLPALIADHGDVDHTELHLHTFHSPNVKAYVTTLSVRDVLADGAWVYAPLDAIRVQVIRVARFNAVTLQTAHDVALTETLPARVANRHPEPPAEAEANRKIADLAGHIVEADAATVA